MDPDAPLVERCLRGDESAWEQLVRRHANRLFQLFYRFTGSRQESEDLTQETFLRIYQTLASYRPEAGHFRTWLTSVGRNLLIDHYRRTRHDRQIGSLDDTPAEGETVASAAPGPEHLAHQVERSLQVQRGLLQLRPELREAIILRDLQGLDYREIQQVLGVPEGTVKSRINRGRTQLARILQQMGIGPE